MPPAKKPARPDNATLLAQAHPTCSNCQYCHEVAISSDSAECTVNPPELAYTADGDLVAANPLVLKTRHHCRFYVAKN